MFVQILYPFNCWFLYILDTSPYQIYCLQFSFSFSVELSFQFLIVSFQELKLLNFDEAQFFCFLLLIMFLVSYLRNYCLIQCHEAIFLCFLLRFVVLGLMFRSIVHFELSLCMVWGTYRFNYIHLYYTWISSFPSTICWKDYSFFLLLNCVGILVKNQLTINWS